jgi:hypothetical protein
MNTYGKSPHSAATWNLRIPSLLLPPGPGHRRLHSSRGDRTDTLQVVYFLLPLAFASHFLLCLPRNLLLLCFLVPHPRMHDAVSFTVHYSFLGRKAVLIRINIWVLFTGSPSARIAWGIQLHKLSWWEINDKLRKGGVLRIKQQTLHNPCLKTQSWLIYCLSQSGVGEGPSLSGPLADHQTEQLDSFPVLHEISHRIFHFKSNGMFFLNQTRLFQCLWLFCWNSFWLREGFEN